MMTEPERQLIDLKQGDHICLIYETLAEQMAAAVPFLKEGLARGERCLYIADDRTVAAIAAALAAAGVAVALERERGALLMLTKQDSYLKGGKFDPEAMIDFLRSAQTQALADGFSGLRVTGEMTWALGPEIVHNQLIEYEALLNRFSANGRSVLLCQFNRERFSPAVIHDVLLTHPLAILGDQVCPNPFYYPPDLALRWQTQPASELMAKRVDWRIRQLKRARAAEQERERTLEKLKQSERKLAEAQQVAHIGSWERDLSTNEVTWSDELYRLFGLQPQEGSMSYERFLSLVSAEEAPRIRAIAEQAIRDHRGFSFDFRILVAGSIRMLRERGTVILDAAGEPVRLVGTAQDVTERRQAEDALRENERKLAQAQRVAHLGYWEYDIDADRVTWSDEVCRIMGAPLHGVRTMAEVRKMIHPDDRPIHAEAWAKALQGPGTYDAEYRVLRPDGEVRFLHSIDEVIRDESGRPRRAFGVLQDITERKRDERALHDYAKRLRMLSGKLLEVQETERRHLARELHDEFAQILATIALHLHAARGQAGPAALPQLDECAALLRQAGEQVRSLALELRPTMLDTLGLEATLRWLAEQHQQRSGCEVQVVGHLAGAPLLPDLAIACFRVAQEALTNVVRHAGARHVWIELCQSESVLELVVRDDGVGFAVPCTQEQATGRGSLGLLGMRERVQILGGRVDVDSEPGLGTRIRASFPLT